MIVMNPDEIRRRRMERASSTGDSSVVLSPDDIRRRRLDRYSPSQTATLSPTEMRKRRHARRGGVERPEDYLGTGIPGADVSDIYDFYPPRPESEDKINDLARIRSGQKATSSTFDRADIFLPTGVREFATVYDDLISKGVGREVARDTAYQAVKDGGHLPQDRGMPSLSSDILLETELDPTFHSGESMEKTVHQIREFRSERSKVLGSALNTMTFRVPEVVMDSIGMGNWWRNQISPETTGGRAAQTVGDLAALIAGPFKFVRFAGKRIKGVRAVYAALETSGKTSLVSKGIQRFFQTAYELGAVSALSEHGGLTDLDIGANLQSRFKQFKSAVPAAGVFAVVGQIAPKSPVLGQLLRQSVGRAFMSGLQYYMASGQMGEPRTQDGFMDFMGESLSEEHIWDTLLHWGIDAYFFSHGVSNKDMLEHDGNQVKMLKAQGKILASRIEQAKKQTQPFKPKPGTGEVSMRMGLVEALKAIEKMKKKEGLKYAPIKTYDDVINWQSEWYKKMDPLQKRIWEDINVTNEGKQLVNLVRNAVMLGDQYDIPLHEFTEGPVSRPTRPLLTTVSPSAERAIIEFVKTEQGQEFQQQMLKLRLRPNEAMDVVEKLMKDTSGIVKLDVTSKMEREAIEGTFEGAEEVDTLTGIGAALNPEVMQTLNNILQTAQSQKIEVNRYVEEQVDAEATAKESGRLTDLVEERTKSRRTTSAEKLADLLKNGVAFDSTEARIDLRAGQYKEDRTNLLNRKGMNRVIEEGTKRGTALNKPLSLWQMDLDNFKKINDNFGMEAGDAVLQIVADVLTEASYDTQVGLRGVISKPGRPNIGDEFEVASHMNREQAEKLSAKAEEIFNKEITKRIEELLGKEAKKKGIELPRIELTIGTHTIPAEELPQYEGKTTSDGKLEVLASVGRLRQEAETDMKRKKRLKKEVLGEEDRGKITAEYQKKVDAPVKVVSSDPVSSKPFNYEEARDAMEKASRRGTKALGKFIEAVPDLGLSKMDQVSILKRAKELLSIKKDAPIESEEEITERGGFPESEAAIRDLEEPADIDTMAELEIWSEGGSKITLLTLQERADLEASGNLQAHRAEVMTTNSTEQLKNMAVRAKKEHLALSENPIDRAHVEVLTKELENRGFNLNTLKKLPTRGNTEVTRGILNKAAQIKGAGSVESPSIDGSPARIDVGGTFTFRGQKYKMLGKGRISFVPEEGTTLKDLDNLNISAEVVERIRAGDFSEFENFTPPPEQEQVERVAKKAQIEQETGKPPPPASDEVAQNSNMQPEDFVAAQVAELPDTAFGELMPEEVEQMDLVDLVKTQYEEMQESHKDEWKRGEDEDGILDFFGSSHFQRTFKNFSKGFMEMAKGVSGIEGVHYPDQKDLREIWSLIQTPEDVGRSFPEQGVIYDITDAQAKHGSELLHEMVGSEKKDGPLTYFVDPKYLPENDAVGVNKALLQEYYGDKLIPKETLLASKENGGWGFNEAQIRAYEGVRQFFNQMAPMMLYELAVEMQANATAKGKPIPDFNPETFLNYITENPAYLPSMRYGEWYIRIRPLAPGSRTAENPQGTPVEGGRSAFFEMHENAPRLFRGATIKQRLFGSLRPDAGMGEKFVDQLAVHGKHKAQTQANRLAKTRFPQDKFHYEIDKVTKLDSSFYEDIPLIKIEAAIRNATMPEEIKNAAVQGVRRVLMARGFAAHMLPKQGTPGVYRDFRRSSLDYAAKLATYIAKMKAMPKYSDALAKIDAKKQPNLYRYANRYIKYFLLPTSALEMPALRGLLFDWLISGKLSSAVLNGTANIIFTTPLLGMHLEGNPVARIAKSRAMILKAMEEVVSHNANIEGVLNAEEADALERGLKAADLTAQMMEDIIGLMRGHLRMPGMKGWGIRDALRTPFAYVERVLNREATMLAFYRTFRAKGMDHDVAINHAIKWVENSHFRYGRHNRPRLGRGIGAPVLVFKSFLIQAVQLQKNLILGKYSDPAASIGKMKQWQAFGESMGSMIALGGLMALPFMDELKDFFLAMWGIDVEEAMRRGVQKAGNGRDTAFMEQALMRGLPASLPEKYAFDMSGPVGLDIVPLELRPRGGKLVDVKNLISDLAGAPSIIWQRGWAAKEAMDVERGQIPVPGMNSYEIDARYYLFFESVSPDFIRNALRAWRLNQEGALTRGGKMIYDPKTHKRYKLTDFQAMMKALGFQPREMNAIYDYMLGMEAHQAQYTQQKSKLTKRMASAMARGNRDEIAIVNREKEDWNLEHKGDPSMQIKITRADIAKRLGAGMFPTKRAYQQYLRRMETYR